MVTPNVKFQTRNDYYTFLLYNVKILPLNPSEWCFFLIEILLESFLVYVFEGSAGTIFFQKPHRNNVGELYQVNIEISGSKILHFCRTITRNTVMLKLKRIQRFSSFHITSLPIVLGTLEASRCKTKYNPFETKL